MKYTIAYTYIDKGTEVDVRERFIGTFAEVKRYCRTLWESGCYNIEMDARGY